MRLIRLMLFVVLFPSLCGANDSYLDVVYRNAARHWSLGQFQEAINQWFKYLEIASRLETENIHGRMAEVKVLYQEGREKLRKEQPLPVPSPSPVPKIIPQKPPVSGTSLPTTVASKDPALAKRLLEKAEKAEYAGHYEESRRLVRLAVQCDPADLPLRRKLEELDRMLE